MSKSCLRPEPFNLLGVIPKILMPCALYDPSHFALPCEAQTVMRQIAREQDEALEDPDKAFKEEIESFHKEEDKRLGRGKRGRGRGRGRAGRKGDPSHASSPKRSRKQTTKNKPDEPAEAKETNSSSPPKLLRSRSRRLGLLSRSAKKKPAARLSPRAASPATQEEEDSHSQPAPPAASSPKQPQPGAKPKPKARAKRAGLDEASRDEAKVLCPHAVGPNGRKV